MTREEKARELCRRLTADVRAIAPTGLAQDDRAWVSVAAAADAFLDALHEWEEDGDRERIPALRVLYDGVLDSWRRAAQAMTAVEPVSER